MVKIGLWGGPSSGKTTYLASLRIATLLDDSGEWVIDGDDSNQPGSTNFLAEATSSLRRGVFPAPTVGEKPTTYAYNISGKVNRNRLDKILGKPQVVDFTLLIRDYPGGKFASIMDPEDEIWDHLAGCQGLIYLFDLNLEAAEKPNFEYVQKAVNYIKLRSTENLIDGLYLPHFVAVCISKYDDPSIINKLQQGHQIYQSAEDTRGTPQVLDVKRTLETIADPLLVRTLERYFREDRVHYFVTSSIGFYSTNTNRIDLDDCCNVAVTPNGKLVRSGRNIVPVNVFAPLYWVAECVQKQAASEKKR